MLSNSFRFLRMIHIAEKPAHLSRAGLILSHTDFGFTAELHRQLLAAAAAARSQNPAAVPCRHAGAESMDLIALTLLGLISTKHFEHSSFIDILQGLLPRRFTEQPL